MFQDKYVFSQIVSFLNRSKFNRIVDKYKGDRYVKHFTCWNQLLTMMFGQLSARESLRDVVVALDAHHSKCYHLGVGKNVSKTTLARANADRDFRIFEEFAYYLVQQAQSKRVTNILGLSTNVYAFDSTTVHLCLEVFSWALSRKGNGGIKIHTLFDVQTQIPTVFHITNALVNDMNAMDLISYETGSYYIFDRGYTDFCRLYTIHSIDAYFVIRPKENMNYRTINWKRKLDANILSDRIIILNVYGSKKSYPEPMRLVRFWDEKQERELSFLTNATHISATKVAELYKNRWQVELFFKWLKQHLKIKKFWGENENAVRIQIYSAMITYCLVAIIQHDMDLKNSTYEILQILSISLTDKTSIKELFDKTKFQNIKELYTDKQSNLFNY